MSPIPNPGAMPKKGSRPGAAQRPVPVAPGPHNDPARWGRVDESGTVYVTTPDGERAIGQWQAGTPAEGLAHYGKRYDDLSTEIALLETRLKANPGEAGAIKATASELLESLPTAAVIGDLGALENRLRAVMDHSVQAGEQAKADKERRRAEAIAAKEKLAAEAEDLAENSNEWKAAGDRIRAILEEWKQIRGIDRKTDDALWKRYSRARDSFNRRRGSHFAELDRARAAAKAKKQELIERAEAIKDSTDWAETARAFRDLMTEWKAAGRAQRDTDDKLWAAFKAAQDHFFDARNAVNDERDREYASNAAAKDALIAEYDALINPAASISAAKAKLRELQEKWEQIGYVPRGRMREYEDKIAALEKRVTDAEESEWRRTDPAAQARVAQFQAKVDSFRSQAEAAEAKGDAARAQSLRAQAAQWEEFTRAAAHALEDK